MQILLDAEVDRVTT